MVILLDCLIIINRERENKREEELHLRWVEIVEHRRQTKENKNRERKKGVECDAPFSGGPLTTRQLAEYKWMSGYPTPLQKKSGRVSFVRGALPNYNVCMKPVPSSPR